MLRVMPLAKTVVVTVPASGAVTASIGPTRYGEDWTVTSVAVQSTSITAMPLATLTIAGVVQGATYTGTADSTTVAAQLWQGHLVSVTWSPADVGAVCTLSVYGSRTIRGG